MGIIFFSLSRHVGAIHHTYGEGVGGIGGNFMTYEVSRLYIWLISPLQFVGGSLRLTFNWLSDYPAA